MESVAGVMATVNPICARYGSISNMDPEIIYSNTDVEW
jgi:hypothetical protein